MEQGVFPKSAVADILEPKFVEARLHFDYPENRVRQLEMVQSNAQPIYLVLDPETETVYARFDGASLISNEPFLEFLEEGWSKARPDLNAAASEGAQ